ncbi:MAG: ribosome assembly cofactor RimP [Bacteroidaceae bacterium]|nr:ribosome assembly cofactor RimP [Bacteroidaceae bacterium]MBR6926670.1 ribosome assembly cofactor RimP [Bacteroidaceae bacterium]MBR7028486.1 ribosome assembly cofactor RimP [Bacteroidaceae bacterium]
MIDKNVVENIVSEWLNGKDYFLTDLTITPDNRIVVEIDHKDGVWIDDCVELSRFIEDHLDRDEQDFELEVGSAGIGQPFKVLRQYENHIGDTVEVAPKSGRKYVGTLTEANAEGFTVEVEQKVKHEGEKRPRTEIVSMTFRYDDVRSVKYVIQF